MTPARFGNLALLLTALLIGNSALSIVISGATVRLAKRHFGLIPTSASADRMTVESLAVLVGLVVLWCLGSLRSLRSILLATGAVAVTAVVLPLVWP